MASITKAINDADERKRAVLGDRDGMIFPSDTANAARLLFTGFDIEHEELINVSHQIGVFFTGTAAAQEVGLRPLFTSSWMDGLLIGLYLAQQLSSPTNPADGPEPTIGGEGG